MGIFSSKGDVKTIETIEMHVVTLIVRIKEQESKIDQHLQEQILKALHHYYNQIENANNHGYVSNNKTKHMKDLIQQAQSGLEQLSTYKCESGNYYTGGKNSYELRNCVEDIKKRSKSDKTTGEEIGHMLGAAIECSQKLAGKLKKEEQSEISVLILELYLKAPQIKVSNFIKQSRKHIQECIGLFNMFDEEHINVQNVEDVENQLKIIKKEVDVLYQTISRMKNNFEQKISKQVVSNCDLKHRPTSNVLKLKEKFETTPSTSTALSKICKSSDLVLTKLDNDLNIYSNVVKTLYPPVSGDSVSTIAGKINQLQKFCNKLGDDAQIAQEKKRLCDKGTALLHKLENIDKENTQISTNLKALKDIEDKLFVLIESQANFEEKRQTLNRYLTALFEMNVDNSEVHNQNIEITNRIEGFVTLETANFLRQMKRNVDHCAMHAEEFPFPPTMRSYDVSQKEIISVLECLENQSQTDFFVQERVKSIDQKARKALQVLDKKAKENSYIIDILNYLENIKWKIININDSPLNCLYYFNTFRVDLGNVRNVHHRIFSKKEEIFYHLHDSEHEIYSKQFPEIEDVKKRLNECEKRTLQFIHSVSREDYQREKEEIYSLWEIAQTKTVHYDEYFAKIFYDTVNIMLNHLENIAKENQHACTRLDELDTINHKIRTLKKSTLSPEKQEEFIQQRVETLQRMETVNEKKEVLDKIKHIEISADIENAKMDLIGKSNYLQQLRAAIKKLTHPIDTSVFKENLYQIFILKEDIEDMPEGDKDLDLQKQSFLQEIYKILHHLDEHVAKAASNRKQTENFLELEDHFKDFKSETLNIPKSSMDFVQIVRKRAESFEDSVRFYLGTSTSVDFYVIHENLVRLLEELDCVVCEDEELLRETVAVMDYVKKLIEELKSNAANE